jgi:hypothetical protein
MSLEVFAGFATAAALLGGVVWLNAHVSHLKKRGEIEEPSWSDWQW